MLSAVGVMLSMMVQGIRFMLSDSRFVLLVLFRRDGQVALPMLFLVVVLVFLAIFAKFLRNECECKDGGTECKDSDKATQRLWRGAGL